MIVEVSAPGMTAMSAPVRARDGRTIGMATIAGPVFRLTEEHMMTLGPHLVATATEIADTSDVSPLFHNKAA